MPGQRGRESVCILKQRECAGRWRAAVCPSVGCTFFHTWRAWRGVLAATRIRATFFRARRQREQQCAAGRLLARRASRNSHGMSWARCPYAQRGSEEERKRCGEGGEREVAGRQSEPTRGGAVWCMKGANQKCVPCQVGCGRQGEGGGGEAVCRGVDRRGGSGRGERVRCGVVCAGVWWWEVRGAAVAR